MSLHDLSAKVPHPILCYGTLHYSTTRQLSSIGMHAGGLQAYGSGQGVLTLVVVWIAGWATAHGRNRNAQPHAICYNNAAHEPTCWINSCQQFREPNAISTFSRSRQAISGLPTFQQPIPGAQPSSCTDSCPWRIVSHAAIIPTIQHPIATIPQ